MKIITFVLRNFNKNKLYSEGRREVDISFHYFAVKTLALEAGFNNDEAQRIATFSQYVDDYNAYISYIYRYS